MKYCLQCKWHVSRTETGEITERSREAIAHFVETGHPIDSAPSDAVPIGGLENATEIEIDGGVGSEANAESDAETG